MPLRTINPTNHETPDSGQGGSAVTGDSNTGHAATTSAASLSASGTASENKTCRWFAVPLIVGQITNIDLKFSWSVNGSVNANTTISGETADASIQARIQYSLNGGGAWTTKVNQTAAASSADGVDDSDTLTASGSETQSIPISTPLNQIQVRDSIEASADLLEDPEGGGSATASIALTVTDIRIEVTYSEPQPVFIS